MSIQQALFVLLQKIMLNVPQLFRKVHIVVMGIFKPFDLIPEGIDLFGAIGTDGLYIRGIIDFFPILKMGTISSLAAKSRSVFFFQVKSGSKIVKGFVSSTISSCRQIKSAAALPVSRSKRRYTFLKWGLVILAAFSLILIFGMILPFSSSTAASL